MALEIKWTTRADKRLDEIIAFLLSEWGELTVREFIKNLYDFLEVLSEFPEIGPVQAPEKRIRGFILVKQISFFYKVQGNQIIVLDLFDNRRDPDKRGF